MVGGWLVLATRGTWWVVPALFVQGIFVNALFGAMHESVHYGSFRSRRAADVLAFFSGAAILNNAGFYRHYHTAHHRYTQDPARDPELLTSVTPTNWSQYLLRMSALPFVALRARDILLAHLGIWERQDPWAPAVLEPLMTGLEQRGLCFAPLREHPRYSSLFATPPNKP